MRLGQHLALIIFATAWATTCVASESPYKQAEQLLTEQRYQTLQDLLEPLQRSHRNDGRLWYLLGRAAFGMQDVATAEKHLKKAAQVDNTNAEHHYWYARSSCDRAQQVNMLRARGFATRCRDAFQAAADLEPENLEYQRALARFYIQAPSIAGGDIDKAMQIANHVQSFDPLQGQLLALDIHVQQEEYDQFQQLLASSELLQSRPEPYVTQGFYFQRQEQFAQAIASFETATQAEVTHDDENLRRIILQAWYQIGRTAVLGETELAKGIDAMEHYRKHSSEPDERNEWADLRLAQLYILNEQADQAQELIQSLRRNGQDERVQKELRKLL